MRRALRSLLIGLSIAAVGCDNETPGSPSPPPALFEGTWSGDVVVQGIPVPARMTWTLAQNGNDVTGPARVALPTGIVLMNASVAGTADGPSLTYTMTIAAGGIPSEPGCTGQLGGSVTAAGTGPNRTLNGSYTVITSSCPSPLTTGTFTLGRQ